MAKIILADDHKAHPQIADFFSLAGFGEEPPARFVSLLAKPAYQTYLIKDEAGAIITACLCHIVGDEAEIIDIATHPDKRQQGWAKKLLESLIPSLDASHIARLMLEVAATNQKAYALYQSCGFAEIGRRAGYYQRDSQKIDALIMELWLSKR